jgi:hypothetical protein
MKEQRVRQLFQETRMRSSETCIRNFQIKLRTTDAIIIFSFLEKEQMYYHLSRADKKKTRRSTLNRLPR